jgi:hypothetical protein
MNICQQCGADISDRHYHAKFCFPCNTARQRFSTAMSSSRSQLQIKHKAIRKITAAAVRAGFLQHPSDLDCMDCGKPAECYDHRDYNMPLEVQPVCCSCNSARGAGVPLDRDLFVYEPKESAA